jgi:hypothetical protein
MTIDTAWYEISDPSSTIMGIVDTIANQYSMRRAEYEQYLAIYNYRDSVGTGRSLQDTTAAIDNRVRFNLFRSVIGSAGATIGSTRVAIRFFTDSASWSLRHRAKKREQVIRSIFDDNTVYRKFRSECFVDACLGPFGAMKVFAQDGQLKIERVLPGEILVDVNEGIAREPENMYQAKVLSRSMLKRLYPDKTGVIEASAEGGAATLFGYLGYDISSSQVLVVEAWHLPTKNAAGEWAGGKHSIVTSAGVLVGPEDYNVPHFPFAFFRWGLRATGFVGTSICEELRGHQQTIAWIDERVGRIGEALSITKIFIPAGTKPEALNTEIDQIVEIPPGSAPPTIVAPQVLPIELLNFRRETIDDAFKQFGLQDMQVNGARPPGLSSGEALRELKDSGSQRFKDKVEMVEEFYVDLARTVVRVLENAIESGEITDILSRVKVGSRTYVERLKWKEEKLEEDEFWISVMPSSSLPQDPAGRIQRVREMQAEGWIDQKTAMDLLNIPDLESHNNTALSALNECYAKIEDILDNGAYRQLDPADDFKAQFDLAISAYNEYKRTDIPRERLDLLLKLADEAQSMLEKASMSAGPAATPPVPGMPEIGQSPPMPPGMPPITGNNPGSIQ